MYGDLIDSLSKGYRLQRARSVDSAKRYLSDPENCPFAILLPDAALAKPKHKGISGFVANYVKTGGIFVCAATFSSFVTPKDMNKFWNTLGLTWKKGDYHRTVRQQV
jgi:hypothetical protein